MTILDELENKIKKFLGKPSVIILHHRVHSKLVEFINCDFSFFEDGIGCTTITEYKGIKVYRSDDIGTNKIEIY